jgi:tetratricopeptide (TPR) repeat protein
MQKARLGETISTSSEASDKMLTFCKHQPNSDFSDLISELTELEHEGNDLLKQSKLEDAKNKFMKGNDKFELVAEKIYNLLTNNDQVEKILSLHKYSLSKIAQCFFAQKKYKEAIEYDLKLICLDPKNCEAIYRLFYSYSQIDKCQQAVYYGDIFLDFDEDIKNKFKNAKNEIEKERIKLQSYGKNSFNKMIFNLMLILIIFAFVALFFKRIKSN